jgi:hypothetical protein
MFFFTGNGILLHLRFHLQMRTDIKPSSNLLEVTYFINIHKVFNLFRFFLLALMVPRTPRIL